MPPRDLVPMFEQVLTDLRALLVLGGFTLDEPSLTLAPVLPSAPAPASTLSPPPSPSATKPKQCFNDQDRDAVARWIVIQFTNDYQSYCGIAQGHYPSLHSKAQSYLTSLAYRTLGGPFIHPPQPSAIPPTPLTPSQSQNPLTLTLPTSVAPHPPQPAGSVQEPINNRSPGAIFQRRHHSARSVAVPGVLEMYKALIKALLSLFELGQKEQEGPTEIGGRIEVKTVDSTEGTTSRPVFSHGNHTQDFPSGSEDDDEDHKIDDSTGRLGMTLTAVEDVSMDLSSLKRKGSVSSTSPRPKRTRPGRPGVTTRAESKRKTDIKKAVVHISKQLSSMETRPEQWKELQFLHVRWLRWDWCNHCDQELCLQCGASSHHETQDCFTYMGSLVSGNGGDSTGPRRRSLKASDLSPVANASPTKASSKGKDRSDLDANTIQWKLANTNPCPNCCILIHRDDGCNKMDCMLCGYRFCWICREPWGVSCGFFKCGRKDVDADAQKSHGSTAGHGIEESQPSEGQVRSLEVSRSTTGDAEQPISRQEQRWDPLDEASAARVEKPEIGVPNVYVIHTKRSRA
ncbi:E3 ubiquitin-protein ligase arih2 [Dissophora globulifera]|nr:E3 ubiquitin-protein ligase arih2 [Dissophora globulifera]